jgi:hypothetical protein
MLIFYNKIFSNKFSLLKNFIRITKFSLQKFKINKFILFLNKMIGIIAKTK